MEIARMLELQGQGGDQPGSTTGFLVSGYDRCTWDEQIGLADHFYVACDPGDGKPIGFVLAHSERLVEKHEEIDQRLRRLLTSLVVIKQIAVDPNYGRRGGGRTALRPREGRAAGGPAEPSWSPRW